MVRQLQIENLILRYTTSFMQKDKLEKDTEVLLEKLLQSARDTDPKVNNVILNRAPIVAHYSCHTCMQFFCLCMQSFRSVCL